MNTLRELSAQLRRGILTVQILNIEPDPGQADLDLYFDVLGEEIEASCSAFVDMREKTPKIDIDLGPLATEVEDLLGSHEDWEHLQLPQSWVEKALSTHPVELPLNEETLLDLLPPMSPGKIFEVQWVFGAPCLLWGDDDGIRAVLHPTETTIREVLRIVSENCTADAREQILEELKS